MMKWLRKYQYQITIGMAATMILYIFFQLGAEFFVTSKNSPHEAIIEVDGEKIAANYFQSHYRRAMEQASGGKQLDPAAQVQIRDEATRDLVQSLVFAREAKRYGIRVPDRQVALSLAQEPAFQEKGAFSPRLYVQILQSQLRLSPQEFEEEKRRAIAFYKLRWMIQSAIKVTDREYQLEGPMKEMELKKNNPKEKVDLAKLRGQMWQEKVLYSFNQWFNQLGRSLKVKTHFELLDQGTR